MITKSAEERNADASDPTLRANLQSLAAVVWYAENKMGKWARRLQQLHVIAFWTVCPLRLSSSRS